MTRPQIVRADTLDLQDHETPSAQDHSRQPTSPAPLGAGPPAPHQESSLRHVAEERHAEHDHLADQWGSGRSSHEGSELLDDSLRTSMEDVGNNHEARLDEAAVQQNGGDDSEMIDTDGEDGIDDGLDDADKISSSPSIDDDQDEEKRTVQFRDHHLQNRRSSSLLDPSFSYRITGLRQRNAIRAILPFEQHNLQRTHSFSTMTNLENVLLPAYDPLLDSTLGSESDDEFDEEFDESDLWEYEEDDIYEEEPFEGNESNSSDLEENESDLSNLEDDDSTDISISNESRFIDSGWGGQCLQELEDIDFEFVYALHTFVATVEGQANATKGDTMVLLDDSNSYWWLVRVVKDSSIGYLPAEHIETPTERLARLNKHRNIDLSATMLGDNPEKSKNPLKKAMRRRNAKIVQFSTPTYFEPVEVDWSDVEGEDKEVNDAEENINGREVTEEESEELATADVSQTNGHVSDGQQDSDEAAEVQTSSAEQESKDAIDMEPTDEELDESQASTPSRSRNGTMRNTDSFFKDDTAEPRKISLTPNILRDENDSSGRSSDSKEKAPASQDIFEQVERSNSLAEKSKDDRKKKEKRPGVLSGLFKRKDKKIKVDEAAGGVVTKQEVEVPQSPLLSSGFSPTEAEHTSPTAPSASSPTIAADRPANVKRQHSGGKLTKAPPSARPSQTKSQTKDATEAATQSMEIESTTLTAASVAQDENSETSRSLDPISTNLTSTTMEAERTGRSGVSPTSSPVSPLSSQKPEKIKREKLKKATQRMDLDVDSSPEREPSDSNSYSTADQLHNTSIQDHARGLSTGKGSAQNPSSDAQVLWNGHQALSVDTSAYDNNSSGSSDSPPTPFEGAVEGEDFYNEAGSKSSTEISSRSAVTAAESLTTPTASSPATTAAPATPPQFGSTDSTWNDASLRSYLDNHSHNDVRDLLLVIQDKTDVVPVSHDHPLMKDLGFHEQRKQLNDMSTELDGLLNGYLARRAARTKKATASIPTR